MKCDGYILHRVAVSYTSSGRLTGDKRGSSGPDSLESIIHLTCVQRIAFLIGTLCPHHSHFGLHNWNFWSCLEVFSNHLLDSYSLFPKIIESAYAKISNGPCRWRNFWSLPLESWAGVWFMVSSVFLGLYQDIFFTVIRWVCFHSPKASMLICTLLWTKINWINYCAKSGLVLYFPQEILHHAFFDALRLVPRFYLFSADICEVFLSGWSTLSHAVRVF